MEENFINELLGLSLGIIFIVGFLSLIVVILYYVGLWKLFEKCHENGWAAIIPYYSSYVLTKIAGLHPLYFILIIARPIVKILDINVITSAFKVLLCALFILSLHSSFLSIINLNFIIFLQL